MKLTIIVCTYNREDLIGFCLQSLVDQTCPKSAYEVLIVDNNSTDDTGRICKSFVSDHSNFRYLKETKQGLGFARNTGYKKSDTEWVAYVDDDAKAHPNYVERALFVIEKYSFDCFGGVYNAWYTDKRPRWISENFGTNKAKQSYTGELVTGVFEGGNMVWKKSVLEELGGFHTEVGMIGKNLGYGEETYIQMIARQRQYVLGFDPFLQVDHYVQPYKLTLSWHLKGYHAYGKDYWKTYNCLPSRQDASLWNYQWLIRDSILKGVKRMPKLLLKQNYYWQNFLIEVLEDFAIQSGKIRSARKMLRKEEQVQLEN